MTHPDPQLSEALVSHREGVHRYIFSIVRNRADAEDLTQDTFVRACDKLASLQEPERAVAWLYRIATNLCYDRFRKASYRKRPQSLDGPGDDPRGPAPIQALADAGPRLDKVLEQKEMSACVQSYLTDLPDTYRAAILLHDLQGLTNPEIAAMLGITLATVKIRLHRARDRLRGVLEKGCSFSRDERGVLLCEPKPRKEHK